MRNPKYMRTGNEFSTVPERYSGSYSVEIHTENNDENCRETYNLITFEIINRHVFS